MQARYREWLAEGTSRRWMIVVGGILINLALGVLYAWSVFRSPLVAEFKWDALTATWPFILATVVFTILMIPAGRWNDRFGPMPVGVAGGVLMGIAFILSSFAPKGAANSGAAFTWLMVTYGVLAGAAMGLGYAVPVATGVKWFPDKRGLVVGLSVMGFGGSSLIFGPLANTMILQSNVWTTFFQLGIVFLVMVVVGSLLLTTTPTNWRPAGWTPPAARVAASGREEKRDFSPRELLRIPQTYMLILMYAFATQAGLMVISFAKNYLDSFKFNDIAAAQGLGWINAIPVVGYNIFTGRPAELSAALVGWLALRQPVVVPGDERRLVRHQARGGEYGIIFIGWGLAGMIGPIVGNFGVQALGGYQTGFIIAAVLGLVAGIMSYTIKRPHAREEMEAAPARA